MYDIIPDIHGHADKLDAILQRLGWRRTTAGWQAPDPERRIVFLGDFIDRGPENARVIRTVRSAVEKLEAWRRYYDEERQHGAIGNKVPITLTKSGGVTSPSL
jgi:hypothetical protein